MSETPVVGRTTSVVPSEKVGEHDPAVSIRCVQDDLTPVLRRGPELRGLGP